MNTHEDGAERAVRVLRAAASYEPDAPAPLGLAERALARHARRRRPLAAVLLPAVGCAAVGLLAAIVRPAPSGPEPAAVRPGREVLGPRLAHDPGLQFVGTKRTDDGAAVAVPNRQRAEVRAPGKRTEVGRRKVRVPERRRSARDVPSRRPARARWQNHTVRLCSSGVLAPVLVVSPGEGGRVAVTPGLADIPLDDAAADSPASDASRGLRVEPVSDTHGGRSSDNDE